MDDMDYRQEERDRFERMSYWAQKTKHGVDHEAFLR